MNSGTTQRAVAALQGMSVPELIAQHQKILKCDPRTHNRPYLIRFLAKRIQENAQGGLSERARGKIRELADDGVPVRHVAPKDHARSGDPRRPPIGTEIHREYGGEEHVVTVFEEHFGYRGERYRSLSQIAKLITKKTWNGWLFFGLTARKEESEK